MAPVVPRGERALEVGLLTKGEIAFEALPDARVGKVIRHTVAIGAIREPSLELRQVVLRARVFVAVSG